MFDLLKKNIIILIMKKKIFKNILAVLFLMCLNLQAMADTDYAKLYESAQVPDFELVHNLDPYQNEDYQKYAWSPFPLFRLSSDVYFKNQTIPAGYYILTPRTIKGREYIFFKEAGLVKYIIPVVKKEMVPVDFYHSNLPTPKLTKWQKFTKSVSDGFYTIFRNSSRKAPPPKSYIITECVDGDMYVIALCYGEMKYYIAFKANKY